MNRFSHPRIQAESPFLPVGNAAEPFGAASSRTGKPDARGRERHGTAPRGDTAPVEARPSWGPHLIATEPAAASAETGAHAWLSVQGRLGL